MLWLLIAACTPTGPAAPPAAPEAPVEDRRELLTDVQHLVGEAAALHAAGRTLDAQHLWDRAYSLWQRHLAVPLREADPLATVTLEYELGRLRAELATPRGRPKALAAKADRLLELRRPDLQDEHEEGAGPRPSTPTSP